MAQYIDKSAIIAEIRSLQDSTMDEYGNFYTAKAQAEYNILCMLEIFLDTIEAKEVQEEPVSEDLEEAARKIATRHSHITGDTYYVNDAWFFKKGAQWQKEKMLDKACEWLKSNLYNYAGEDDKRNIVPFDNAIFHDFKKAMEE